MNIRKLSWFIIAVGVILVALGYGHWIMAEEEVKHQDDYRKEMRLEKIKRLANKGDPESFIESDKLKAEMYREQIEEIDMLLHGYKLKVDHTISYSLMISGILVLIMGIGVRVSSKKPETESKAKAA